MEKAGLFEHLNNITKKNFKSYDWLKANDYKKYIYILNRYISMDKDFVEFANIANVLNIEDEQLHFEFFYHLLPKTNKFFKYIKGSKGDKVKNQDLIDDLQTVLKISKKDISEYLDSLSKEQIKEIKKEFGGKIR